MPLFIEDCINNAQLLVSITPPPVYSVRVIQGHIFVVSNNIDFNIELAKILYDKYQAVFSQYADEEIVIYTEPQ